MKHLVIPFLGQCEESFCDYFCRSLLVDFLYHLPLPYSVQSKCIDIFIACVRYRLKMVFHRAEKGCGFETSASNVEKFDLLLVLTLA